MSIMNDAVTPHYHLRPAQEADAPSLAQLIFDVIESNPLQHLYTELLPSPWREKPKAHQEIGGTPELYRLFLEQEEIYAARDIKAMRDDGVLICVAYEGHAPEKIRGCVALRPAPFQNDLLIDRIFADRDAGKIGSFMLDCVKASSKAMGFAALQASAGYGVHEFFLANGFTHLKKSYQPYDNKMVFDLV